MKVIPTTKEEFKKYFDIHYDSMLLPYKDFVGYYDFDEANRYYFINDNRAGFGISKYNELINLYNISEDKILQDSNVKSFLLNEVDFLCCVGYYSYNYGKDEIVENDLSNYYNSTLGFCKIATVEKGTIEDMINLKGKKSMVRFLKEFGMPYQVFMVNPNYMMAGPESSDFSYDDIKKYIISLITIMKTNKK